MTSASKLLPSEEPAALPSLAQPLHRLVKDGRWGSGRRPAECSSGWQGHAGTVVCLRHACETRLVSAERWGFGVCVCECMASLMTKTTCVCLGEVLRWRADRRSELLVQNIARGPRCHTQKQCTNVPARLPPLWMSSSSSHVAAVTQSPCYLVPIASDLSKEQEVLIKAAWERISPEFWTMVLVSGLAGSGEGSPCQ